MGKVAVPSASITVGQPKSTADELAECKLKVVRLKDEMTQLRWAVQGKVEEQVKEEVYVKVKEKEKEIRTEMKAEFDKALKSAAKPSEIAHHIRFGLAVLIVVILGAVLILDLNRHDAKGVDNFEPPESTKLLFEQQNIQMNLLSSYIQDIKQQIANSHIHENKQQLATLQASVNTLSQNFQDLYSKAFQILESAPPKDRLDLEDIFIDLFRKGLK